YSRGRHGMAKNSEVSASGTKGAVDALPIANETEMLQLLVANLKDYAIIMLDPKGNVLTWNSAAEHLKGWKASEIIGQHFSRFYPPDDVQNGKTETELLLAAQDG